MSAPLKEKKENLQEIRILKHQKDEMQIKEISTNVDDFNNFRVVYQGIDTLKKGTILFTSFPVVHLPQQLPFKTNDLKFPFIQHHDWSEIESSEVSLKTLMWGAVGLHLLTFLEAVEYNETKKQIDCLYPRTESQMKKVNVQFVKKFQLSEKVFEMFPTGVKKILAKYSACYNRGFSHWPVSGLLYAGMSSFMNHSCQPNCCYFINPEKNYSLTIRTLVPIFPGDELTYTYTAESLCLLTEKRQEKLFNYFGHTCACLACLNSPVIESILLRDTSSQLGNFFCHYCGKLADSSADMETQMQAQIFLDEKRKEKDTKKTMKRCGKCKQIYYCSLDCQKSHWHFHKSACKRKIETKKKL